MVIADRERPTFVETRIRLGSGFDCRCMLAMNARNRLSTALCVGAATRIFSSSVAESSSSKATDRVYVLPVPGGPYRHTSELVMIALTASF